MRHASCQMGDRWYSARALCRLELRADRWETWFTQVLPEIQSRRGYSQVTPLANHRDSVHIDAANLAVLNASSERALVARHAMSSSALPHAPEPTSGLSMLVGSSPAMCAVRQQLHSLGPFPWPVRIEGARGTGKNVAARFLHHASRRTGAFVRCGLNVVSAAEGRELAELFGWARGAFTGAVHAEPGVFERAHEGTAFLNELGIASPRVQEILLHLLDERTVQRIGEHVPRPVNVRVVFATNVSLEPAVRAGAFRADLYDRLGLHVIRMPTLAARMEDLPELAAAILIRKAREAGVNAPRMRPGDIDRLMTYEWPGNVRELENALEHFVVFQRLPPPIPRMRPPRAWRAAVAASLEQCGGNKSAAARALGISRKTLHAHLKQREA